MNISFLLIIRSVPTPAAKKKKKKPDVQEATPEEQKEFLDKLAALGGKPTILTVHKDYQRKYIPKAFPGQYAKALHILLLRGMCKMTRLVS